MRANRGRSVRGRRLLGLLTSAAMFLIVAPNAGADVKDQLDAAKGRLEQIKREVEGQQQRLDALAQEAAALAMRVDEAQQRWEEIDAQLAETRDRLARATERHRALQDQLNSRARETYMQGAGSDWEFLLGSTSLADLSDRLEFVDAVTQNDADLANRVQNLKVELAAERAHEEQMLAKATEALQQLQTEQAQLDATFAEQRSILDDIEAKRAEAEQLVEKLGKRYQDYLRSLAAVQFHPGSLFQVCPVDQPRAVYDGFGAPRYAGGYHPHAGNDIVAPEGTPIRAPFPGTARASSNTLGGYAVYVYGSAGYVYNAHLMQPGYTGTVQAGDIIGYVGNTGDAQGGVTHDHFEWHPNAVPGSWPTSAYGYTLIGSALNPYPLLQAVC